MSRSDLSTEPDETPVDRVAARLEASELADVAAAAYDLAGALAVRRCGRTATAVAALCVAARRSSRRAVDPVRACKRLDLDPSTVARAVDYLERELSPPAPATEIRSLRQSIVAIDELLSAIERGRANPPRLSGPAFAELDPTVAAMAARPLDELEEAELRAHRRRLEADLELARLGVELYAVVHGDPTRSEDADVGGRD